MAGLLQAIGWREIEPQLFIIPIALIFAGIMMWWIGRRTKRLYEMAVGALHQGRVVMLGPFPQRVAGRWEDREVRIWKREGSESSPKRHCLSLSGHTPYKLTITPEGSLSRTAKKIGLGSLDTEVGDRELDDAFYIRASDPNVATVALRNAGGRAAVFHLYGQGFEKIQLDRKGLRIEKENFGEDDFQPDRIKQRLEVMLVLMEAAEGRDRLTLPSALRETAVALEPLETVEGGLPLDPTEEGPAAPSPAASLPPGPVPCQAEPGQEPIVPSGRPAGTVLVLFALAVLIGLILLFFLL